MKGQHHQISVSLETIGLVPPRWGSGFCVRTCYKHVAPLALGSFSRALGTFARSSRYPTLKCWAFLKTSFVGTDTG